MAPSNDSQHLAPPAQAPKTMSSNLMTMKFMQRAAASTSKKLCPAPVAPESPKPSSKRRKLDIRTPDYGRAEALASSLATPLNDLQRMQVATAEEEAKRERALERLVADAGETKWVLSTAGRQKVGGVVEPGMKITNAGYGDIDENEDGLTVYTEGRRSFGRFDKKIDRTQKDQNDTATYSSQPSPSGESSNGEDQNVEVEGAEEDGDNSLGTRDPTQVPVWEEAQRVRAGRKAKRKGEKQDMVRLAEKTRSKEVKLNRLSSISGGGGISRVGGAKDMSNIECYQCGEKGHERRNCPQKSGRKDGDSDGWKRKRSGDSLDY